MWNHVFNLEGCICGGGRGADNHWKIRSQLNLIYDYTLTMSVGTQFVKVNVKFKLRTYRGADVSVQSCQQMSHELTLRKIAIWMSKNCQKFDIFFKKNWQKFSFFQKNCQWQFFGQKMTIFVNFFWKKCQIFGNFLTFNKQFSGGSARNLPIIKHSRHFQWGFEPWVSPWGRYSWPSPGWGCSVWSAAPASVGGLGLQVVHIPGSLLQCYAHLCRFLVAFPIADINELITAYSPYITLNLINK